MLSPELRPMCALASVAAGPAAAATPSICRRCRHVDDRCGDLGTNSHLPPPPTSTSPPSQNAQHTHLLPCFGLAVFGLGLEATLSQTTTPTPHGTRLSGGANSVNLLDICCNCFSIMVPAHRAGTKQRTSRRAPPATPTVECCLLVACHQHTINHHVFNESSCALPTNLPPTLTLESAKFFLTLYSTFFFHTRCLRFSMNLTSPR
jgi:hypothetical protein